MYWDIRTDTEDSDILTDISILDDNGNAESLDTGPMQNESDLPLVMCSIVPDDWSDERDLLTCHSKLNDPIRKRADSGL